MKERIEVLLSAEQIDRRMAELADELYQEFGDEQVELVCALKGAVGLELVTTYTTADGKQHVYSVEPFSVVKKEGDLYTFQVKHSLSNAGSFKVSYRMFPKNPELPHRQDFCYVRWFI